VLRDMGKTTAGVRGVFNAPTTSADFAHTHSMSVKGGLQSAPTKQYRRLTSQPTGLPRSRPPPVSGSGRPPSASVDVAQVPSLSCPTALRRRVLLGGAVLLASTSLIGTDDAAEAAVGARPQHLKPYLCCVRAAARKVEGPLTAPFWKS
jgi:hypothetical protein